MLIISGYRSTKLDGETFMQKNFFLCSLTLTLPLFCGSSPAQSPGALNAAFQAELQPPSHIDAMVLQPDGKLIVAGSLVPSNREQALTLLRLETDGTIDRTFVLNNSMAVNLVATTPDGKILVSGSYLDPNPITRLNPDGTIDSSFRVRGVTNAFGAETTQGSALAVAPDGKILFGGYWVLGGGVRGIVRINSDGSIDPAFSKGPGFAFVESAGGTDAAITGIIAQPDGKTLVCGSFSAFHQAPREDIVRINSDGTVDSGFNPGEQLWAALSSTNGYVSAMALANSQKIYVALSLPKLGSPPTTTVFRLNPDGTIDPTFTPTGATNGAILNIKTDRNDLAIALGSFEEFAGRPRHGIVRMNANGGVDPAFAATSFDSSLRIVGGSLLVRSDGEILASAAATALGVTQGSGVVLLHGETPQTAAPTILRQPASSTLNEGAELRLSAAIATATFPAPTFQWRLNGRAIPGETNRQLRISAARAPQSGRYAVEISNSAGSVTSDEAVVTVLPAEAHPGSMDIRFQPEEVSDAFVTVRSIAPREGGGIYAARFLQRFDRSEANEVVRFDSFGRLDPGFHFSFSAPDGGGLVLRGIASEPTGDLLVIGGFTSVNGSDRSFLARLIRDGVLDSTFAPAFQRGKTSPPFLNDLAVQPDGRIVVVGGFSTVNGISRTNIVRLLPSGAVDLGFDANAAIASLPIQNSRSVKILANGQILLSEFGLLRLNADGTRDSSYQSVFTASRLAVQSDGKVLLALGNGSISAIGIQTNYNVARLGLTGRPDPDFQLMPDGPVNDVAATSDDQVYLAGSFGALSGVPRNDLARLNLNATVDVSFDGGSGFADSPSAGIDVVLPTSDGRVWIAGNFDRFSGFRRQGIALLFTQESVLLSPPQWQSNRMTLSGSTQTGRVYHLEARDSLTDGSWREVQSVAGDGKRKSFEDPSAIASQRFYRVRVTSQ